jgi:dolichol-phosphate mannosyltransferase
MESQFLTPPTESLVVPEQSARSPLDFSLVIPTFNEAKNIAAMLRLLDDLLRPVFGDRFELIVVDDNSPDETWRIAGEIASKIASVRVVRRQTERGLATAIIRGWQVASGAILGVIDADRQHPPDVLLPLLREIGRGADLATGSRNVLGGGVSDWSLIRRILSRGAQLLGLLILPEVLGRLSDPMSGVFLLRRQVIAGVQLDPLGYKILIEVLGRARVRWIAEVPYVFSEREEGESKVNSRVYVDYLKHLVKLRFARSARSPFLRYLGAEGVGALFDMGLLYAFSEENMLGLGIARSKLIAGTFALAVTFPLHELWTFQNIGRPPGWTHVFRRLFAFGAVSMVGLSGATLALSLLVEFAGLNRYFANAVGMTLVGGWNYLLHRQITWTEVPTRATADPSEPPAPSLTAATIERLLQKGERDPSEWP